MSTNQNILAERLRLSRESAARTQDEVAEALGIPRSAIVQIEAGNRKVSSAELERLARFYHRDISDFLSSEVSPDREDPVIVLHRLAPGLEEDPEIRRQVDHCLRLCQEGKTLEAILGRVERTGPPFYNLQSPSSAGEAVMQGANVAMHERQRLGIGDAPIAEVADLLNSQGVWASGISLPDEMSGLFINHPSTGMVVLVNLNHRNVRRRFSYAHEYGHALMDRERTGNVSSRSNANDLTEKRANAFAAAFLLPSQGIDRLLFQLQKGQPSRIEQAVFDVATESRIDVQLRTVPGSQNLGYQDATMIARFFDVSYEAVVYRLRSLGHLSQNQCENLIAQKELGNRLRAMLEVAELFESNKPNAASELKEEFRPASELVIHIAHLAIEAYRRDEISRGRLLEIASLTDLNGKELCEFAEAARS